MLEKVFIKNVALFSKEGISLNELKKVNFIYGENGTGKNKGGYDFMVTTFTQIYKLSNLK